MLPWLRLGRRGLGRREVERLADTLRRREVAELCYLHCEDFAPWRPTLRGRDRERVTATEDAEHVRRFADAAAANEHARRLTLFYQPHLALAPVKNRPEVRVATPGDPIGFGRPSPDAREIRTRAIAALAPPGGGHDIQVGFDHRGLTWTALLRDHELAEKLARAEVRAGDSARFELALRIALEAIRRETRRPLPIWLFAHAGQALCASDVNVCNLENELEILARNGCVGDFSYPGPSANRPPPFAEPMLVRPVAGGRAWELDGAECEPAWGGEWSAAEKLFLWSSRLNGGDPPLEEDVEDLAGLAQRLIDTSPLVDGRLWLKTHACSLRHGRPGELLALDRPDVQRLLGALFDAAARADVAVRYVTASEVYERFVTAPPEGSERPATVPKAVLERRAAGRLLRRDAIGLIATDEVMSGIATMGLRESGATEFYQGRAEKGQMIAPYEVQIAEMLLQLRPAVSRAYEAGSGAAMLTLLLAANGLAAEGFDRQPHRVGLAERIRERVVALGGPLAAPCEIRRARAPQALRRIDGRDAALLFTNVIGSISDAEEAELIRIAARFRVLVVDLARFLRARDGAAQEALLQRFLDAGCPPPMLLAGFTSFRVFIRDMAIGEWSRVLQD